MIKITYFGLCVKAYFMLEKNNQFPQMDNCTCCNYHGLLHRHGFYYRNAITLVDTYRIPILRVKCPNPSCNTTYSLIPSFLVPYYQYTFAVILLSLYKLYVEFLSCVQISIALNASISHQSIQQLRKRFLLQFGFCFMFFSNKQDNSYILDIENLSATLKAKLLLLNIRTYFSKKHKFNIDFFESIDDYFMKAPKKSN